MNGAPADPTPPARPSWWRRNRLGLLLLPVAAGLALGASMMRLHLFWWRTGPHDVISTTAGRPVSLTQTWTDATGQHTRRVSISVDAVRRAPTSRGTLDGVAGGRTGTLATIPSETDGTRRVTVPDGAAVWDVTLSVRADPREVLAGCTVAVIDTRGREYTSTDLAGVAPADAVKATPCAPDDHAGPGPVVVRGLEPEGGTGARPPAYTTHAVVVTKADSVPRVVRVWWDYPLVVEATVSPST